jgi:hypothetical protein
MLIRIFIFWIPMTFIGIINGIIREATYKKRLGELKAHQVSL